MKRENLKIAQNAIEQAQKIEYVLDRINNPDSNVVGGRFDWSPDHINRDYIRQIMLNLTEDEEVCLNELKGAMTTILRKAAERTLANINAEIEGM